MGYREHQKVVKESILYIQQLYPKIRIFQRHVGLFKTQTGAPIKINQAGMSDVYILVPTALGIMHIECECKTGQATLSKPQKKWRTLIESMGGHFILFHDKHELKKELEKCLTKFPTT